MDRKSRSNHGSCALLVALLIFSSSSYPSYSQSEASSVADPTTPVDQLSTPSDGASSDQLAEAAAASQLKELQEFGRQVQSLSASGDIDAALVVAQKALDAADRLQPTNNAELCLALNNLAVLLQATGNTADARPLRERALRIQEEAFGSNSLQVASCLNQLALLIKSQHDYDSAEGLYRRALTINESHPEDQMALADTLCKLGSLLSDNSKALEALPLYQRAQEIVEKESGAQSLGLAQVLNDEAVVLEDLNQLDDAAKLLQRSLEIKEKQLGANDPDVVENRSNIAMVLLSQRKYKEAIPLLQDVVKSFDKPKFEQAGATETANSSSHSEYTLALDRLGLAKALNNLGNAEYSLGETDAAQKHFLHAAEIIDTHIRNVLPQLSFAEQRAFIAERIPEETSLLLCACRNGEALAKAYDFCFRWKGLLVDCLRRESELTTLPTTSENKKKIERLQQLRSDIAQWYFLALCVNSDTWKQKNEQMTAEKESLERELAKVLGKVSSVDVLGASGSAPFISRLNKDEALADIFLYNYVGSDKESGLRYAAVVSGVGHEPVMIDLGSRLDLDGSIDRWRADVLSRSQSSKSWADLLANVWEPISTALPAGTKKLWLFPDGELLLVPWHLAGRSSESDSKNIVVCQADSARELANLRFSKQAGADVVSRLVLAGGIDFNAKLSKADSVDLGPAAMPLLPGTLTEINQIEFLSKGQNFKLSKFTGLSATKAAVLEALPQARFVHLATHGYFLGGNWLGSCQTANRDTPVSDSAPKTRGIEVMERTQQVAGANRNPLVESGLVFAGVNNIDPSGKSPSSLLTAEELVGLDLSKCRLITLSACDTGLGKGEVGQGIMGMRSSIMAAGARSVLMSLWKVPDASTGELMKAFYTNLWVKGMPEVEALQQAQETVRKAPGGIYAAPVNWAAWILVGE